MEPTSLRDDPRTDDHRPAGPPRRWKRSARRALAVSVAGLLVANGVILTEHLTGRDVGGFVGDRLGRAAEGLATLVGADRGGQIGPEAAAGRSAVGDGGPGGAASPSSSGNPASGPPASGPGIGGPAGDAAAGGAGAPAVSPPDAAPVGSHPAGTTPSGPPLGDDVPALAAFVEQERGLDFVRPAKLVRLAGADFTARLVAARVNPMVEWARKVGDPMRALGLIRPGVNLITEVQLLWGAPVPAFYDPAAGELVVRRDQPETPYVRSVVVRELVHALDDQHFGLHRPALLSAPDESAAAFAALTGGIAALVEERYVDRLPAPERASVEAERIRAARSSARRLSDYVLVTAGFPATAGKRLAAALLAAGGTARLDQALRRPPTTTEQVLRPDAYLAGEGPKALAAPAADGRRTAGAVLGQLSLTSMLSGVLDRRDAGAAAQGWGADHWVAWRSGRQTCVRLAMVADSPADGKELGQALRTWAAAHSGAELIATDRFVLTRCL